MPGENNGTAQSGAVLLLMALLLPVLLLLMAFSLSETEGASRRSELVRSVDAAASAGASVLCSTRNCYNQVLIRVLEALRTMPVKGRVSRPHFVRGVEGALAELRAQDSMKGYIAPASGKTEWLIDGIRIRVQRGRWWKNGAPEDVDRTFLFPPLRPDYQQDYRGEPQFEAFDRFDDIVWQREVPGTPRFIVANAVRVTLTHEKFRSWFSYMTVPEDITADTIAARLERKRENLTFCGAPFAIPVCALLNQDGEFDPAYTCQFDRYFVARTEHPPAPDPVGTNPRFWTGSRNLPGAIWGPLTETYCDQSKPWYSQQRCECFDHAGEDWTKGVVPCAQQFGQGAMQCHLNAWPFFNQVGDHYGVVGISYGSDPRLNEDTVSAADMQALAQKPDIYWDAFDPHPPADSHVCVEQDPTSPSGYREVPGALEYTIGKPFFVREAGLWEPYFDQAVWDKIQNPAGAAKYIQRYHPLQWDPKNPEWKPNGFTDLGWEWFIGLIGNGYPAGAAKGVIDQLVDAHYIEPYQQIGPSGDPCFPFRPEQATAACGSHRAWWDNRCQKYYKMWQVAPRSWGCQDQNWRPWGSWGPWKPGWDLWWGGLPPRPEVVGQGDPSPIDPHLHDLSGSLGWTPQFYYKSPEEIIKDCGGGTPYWVWENGAPPYRGPQGCPCWRNSQAFYDRYCRYWYGSEVFNFDDECQAFVAGLFGFDFHGFLLNPYYGSMWPYLDERGRGWSHPDPSPSPMAFELSGLVQGFSPAQHWSGTFSFDPPTHPYACSDVLPYMPCAAQGAAVPDGEINYQSPTTSQVWNINIPVIADPSGQSCAGVNGSQSDPPVSPVMTIVGFIRTYIIDDDIGFPSPPPPGHHWLNGGQFWQEGMGWRSTVIDADPNIAWHGLTPWVSYLPFGYFYIDDPRGSGSFTELHTDIPSPLGKWQKFDGSKYWNNLLPWMPGYVPPDSGNSSCGDWHCTTWVSGTDPICMPVATPPWWSNS